MDKENEFSKRKPTRLKDFNSNRQGTYFVTVCAKDRVRIFSKIVKTNVTATDEDLPLPVGDGALAF